MRPDTQRRPTGSADPVRDPARAAALHRLASATAGATRPPDAAVPEHDATPDPDGIPWMDADPDGRRPERVPVGAPDATAWADPPWWERIRWAPDRVAGIALVLLVVGLGAFSVHRLLATVPEGPGVPELPLAEPGEEVPAEGPAAPTSAATAAPDDDQASGEEAEEEPVVVSVVGLVGRSGLVTVAPGARVADALDSAGGVLEGGDRDGLNLARRLVDGEQILVGLAPGPDGPEGPRSAIIGADDGGPPAAGGSAPPGGVGADGPLDLNSADATGFESLPGVGPVTASAILAWREANGPFSAVDQLAEVDGIGPATLSRLRPLVTV